MRCAPLSTPQVEFGLRFETQDYDDDDDDDDNGDGDDSTDSDAARRAEAEVVSLDKWRK